jgi:hypothetical protein
VARTPQGTSFESVTQVDSAWEFRTESYFTEACALVEDDSGIGAPAVELGSYWSYQSCLAMTDHVFVIRLADSRHVKLQVTSYYEPTVQAPRTGSRCAIAPAAGPDYRARCTPPPDSRSRAAAPGSWARAGPSRSWPGASPWNGGPAGARAGV